MYASRVIRRGWWWKKRFWYPAKRRYYALRGGLPIGGLGGGMMPGLGRGRYVSVVRRGPFLDLHDERNGDRIRLVPYQGNHGVMVELWRDGSCEWRTHCDLNAFRQMGFGAAEDKPTEERPAPRGPGS